MMNPVPSGAFEVAAAGAAAPVSSDGVFEDPEDSEPPHAATLSTTPTRSATFKPLRVTIFVSMFGGGLGGSRPGGVGLAGSPVGAVATGEVSLAAVRAAAVLTEG